MSNIIRFPTKKEPPVIKVISKPADILNGALDEDLKSVMVLGFRQDGEIFVDSTMNDAVELGWLFDLVRLAIDENK